MGNQSVIFTEDLSSVINIAKVTQNYYDNKKAKDRLKNASGEALIVESHINDIYVLNQVLEKIISLQLESNYTNNKNTYFSKKQTSRQFMGDIKEQLQYKKDSLVGNLKKELNGLPLMSKEYYRILKFDSFQFLNDSKIIEKFYNSKDIGFKDINKEAKNIIKITARPMITEGKLVDNNKVKVLDGFKNTEDGKEQPRYRELNLVDACIYNYQNKIEKNLKDEVLNLMSATNENDKNKPGYKKYKNIDEEYKDYLDYRISLYKRNLNDFKYQYININNLKLDNITNKLIELTTKEVNNSKSIVMYKRFVEFISRNLMNGNKYQIIDKLKKEVRELEQNNIKIYSKISDLQKEFDLTKEHLIEENKKSKTKEEIEGLEKLKKLLILNQKENLVEKNKNSKVKEEIEGLEDLKRQLKLIQNEDITEEIYKRQESKDSKVFIPEIAKVSSLEQKEMYEKYKEIRDRLDEIFSRKSQFSNEEYFRQEVVNTLWQYGNTYEEIIKNIRDMSEQLDVTKVIQQAIEQVRADYNSIDEMNQEDENGLTNFENRIIGRLSNLQMHGGVSDELRSEINYYTKKQLALESELKFAFENKRSYPKEIYQKIVEDLKFKYYLNTNILEEVGLVSKINSSKKY